MLAAFLSRSISSLSDIFQAPYFSCDLAHGRVFHIPLDTGHWCTWNAGAGAQRDQAIVESDYLGIFHALDRVAERVPLIGHPGLELLGRNEQPARGVLISDEELPGRP